MRVLPDGTYLSVLINPTIRGVRRREAIMTAAREVTDGRHGDSKLAAAYQEC